jgi:hypothetical protein
MSILNNINLVMFSTTVGHHNQKDTYKLTLRHTDNLLGLNNFASKTVAIKVHNNDNDSFIEMCQYYKDFNILKEMGQNVGVNPHKTVESYTPYMVANYCVSIANIYSLLPLKAKYTFWLEDDCILYADDEIEKYFEKTINLFEEDKNVFSAHLVGPLDKRELEGTNPGKYSFRPHLSRTIDMYNVANFFKHNINQLINVHPEMAYEMIIKHLYPNSKFMEWNPKNFWHEHIGGPDNFEIIKRLNLTY